MPSSLPTVSALVAAYNYEEYIGRAIESALTQDYPPELIEVVVVDDGSTDATADVAEMFVRSNPDRVRLVRQANGGATCAADRAIAEAKGELLAPLDADDVWLPDKTRRQVAMLQSRPELGLVFCDMTVVDADEVVVRRSHTGPLGPLPKNMFAVVLHENVATSSSIMVRAALRDVFAPIPLDIPYADWWMTLRAAEVSRIDYVQDSLVLYRVHGGNRTGGSSGGALARQLRMSVDFQLLALRRLSLDTLTPEEALYVWSGVEDHARQVVSLAGSQLVPGHSVEPQPDAVVQALLAEAEHARILGHRDAEARLALRALAADPSRIGARARLNESADRAGPAEHSRLRANLRLVGGRAAAPFTLLGQIIAVARWRYRRTRGT
jgi:glycosyltransferase involved in cell wall biosynthesis